MENSADGEDPGNQSPPVASEPDVGCVVVHHRNLDGLRSTVELIAREVISRSSIVVVGLDLKVESGAEISAPLAAEFRASELRELSLGESNWLLVELPLDASSFEVYDSLFDIRERGFEVLLAHPERVPAFQADIGLLGDLVRGGARTQVTAEALIGRFGRN